MKAIMRRGFLICVIVGFVGVEGVHFARFGDFLPPYGIHVDLAKQKSSQGQQWYAVAVRNMTWRSFKFIGIKDKSYSHLSCSNNLVFAFTLERKDANNQWHTLVASPDARTVTTGDEENVTLRPLQSICGGEWTLVRSGTYDLQKGDAVRLTMFSTVRNGDSNRRQYTSRPFHVDN